MSSAKRRPFCLNTLAPGRHGSFLQMYFDDSFYEILSQSASSEIGLR